MFDNLPAPAVKRQFLSIAINVHEILLATWEKPIWFRHFVSDLPLCADLPCKSGDTKYDKTHHCSIRLPIMRLRVPATSRRPDMLGIAEFNDQPIEG